MLVVGVFFACAVTLVAVVMVVAVLDLVLCFWLTVDFMRSPPPFFTFFLVQKWGGGGLPCTYWDRSVSAKNGWRGS